MHSYPSKEYYKKGVKVILYYGERENPNLKVVSTAFRAKVAEKMKEANAHEALLVDRHGFITEGSKSNFFGIKDKLFSIILYSCVVVVINWPDFKEKDLQRAIYDYQNRDRRFGGIK